jgi:hypothetical protein
MNSAITFASFICLLWLTGVVLALPQGSVPLILKLYLLAHLLFLLSGWLANQQWSWYDDHYVRIYTACAIPVFACAILLTLQTTSREDMLPLGLACVFQAAAIFTVSWNVFPHSIYDPRATYLYRLLGLFVVVFVSCGITLFLTMAASQGPIWEKMKITLGAFWLIEGAMHWWWGVLMARGERQKAMELHEWGPALVAVFVFFYLAWSLSSAHIISPETRRTPSALDRPAQPS